ncbi:putative 54S ribosomal protein MRP49, mitochondrial [Schizosaccharomyces pombe]|uniref:Large ribosomal subunit protein mL61 n=1 Tax=Schizosaccharomyces pombe (strain 972 / ATCC 24843) TaxID=284812 RepID=RM49_SCHPO|nr:putative mitochondrial ribosomal protein Mrp49 [Schizosaccharomyces pombe]C6Y4D2.1 RecName: Full=Large ribosomal subunit protein mL61; AltName: Full=Probable 54S ribosomal protein MRP49, mitochondrial [Schizosaccharomyces pombe 972h-]CBA11519.1 mitochondrial ribosomal protein Mrp49 (predicted) [Schizosaccharomyces pombe]|eukprot:NP_001343094.1 putative mitochondrial ribosomal protein Mrp49 [Schizosaccharomyces pombe]
MSSIGGKLQKSLHKIRAGALGIPLPKHIQEVSIQYSLDSRLGHMGAKKFVKECLPSLYYNNYGLKFNVNHRLPNDQTPTFSIISNNKVIYSYDMRSKQLETISSDIQKALKELHHESSPENIKEAHKQDYSPPSN